ncbi:serine--tRNA synthetase-like protein Slimp [Papilio machaon]|uniref:serine--tRNA synthetase-like protein Slimp n=1 Tax=Papilio machaon TaxID=76193 RepID=UPI001E664949|nr:serine--tRNA synthetase-like protein Slimp [Papilio machaon]
MIHKTILSNFFKLRDCYLIHVRNSALFINGPKATDTFVYITPHVDFPEAIKHKEVIQENLAKRKSNIDLAKVEDLWYMYEDLKIKRNELEKKKMEVGSELSNLLKNNPSDNNIEKLKIQSSLLKENIKKLKVPFWSAEEAAIVEALKLPNVLHPKTPSQKNEVLFTYKTASDNDKDHLKIGKDNNLIQFTNKENYYLKGDAAVFELGAKFYFSKSLKDTGFIQFSNTDFVKSLIIEGCGHDHTDPNHTFIIHHNEDTKVNVDNRLHLTGGGSLFSFFAYYTKNVLHSNALPLKYFSMGRQYNPVDNKDIGLFNVSQSSVISMFIATKNIEECDTILDEIIEVIKNIYSNIGYPYRLSIVTAEKLHMWESLRVSIEMYSTSLKSYFEIGNISVSGDFISKRLMFNYTHEKQNKYPHIISGTILNVPLFLGCVLEQNTEFSIPQEFTVNNWCIKQ